MRTRRPMPREPDSLRVSTSPMRTSVENSSPSRMVTSASDAPLLRALETMSAASDWRSFAASWDTLLTDTFLIRFDWIRRQSLYAIEAVAERAAAVFSPVFGAVRLRAIFCFSTQGDYSLALGTSETRFSKLEGIAGWNGLPRIPARSIRHRNELLYIHYLQRKLPSCLHRPVPPTVMRSSFTVGMPTPTGTLWPSLPQVPTPSSSSRSLPTIETYLRASGPLPIRVASRTGAVILPSSIR